LKKKNGCEDHAAKRLPGRRGVVRIGKVLDPGDHRSCTEAGAIALNIDESETKILERTMPGTFEVDSSRKRDPVARPATSVGEEVISLRGTCGSIRVRKMVRPANNLVVRRAFVVMLKSGSMNASISRRQ
jgi:hypothetical protein